MSIGGGSSKSQSTTTDKQAPEFTALRGPLQDRLMRLMGFVPGPNTGRMVRSFGGGLNPQGGLGGGAGTGGTGTSGSGAWRNPNLPDSSGQIYRSNSGKLYRAPQGSQFPSGTMVRDDGTFMVPRGAGSDLSGNANYNLVGGGIPFTPGQGSGGGGSSWQDLAGIDPNSILSGVPTYKGKLVADMTPEERATLARLTAFGKSKTGTTGSFAENELMKIIEESKVFGASNPFVKDMIEAAQRPTREALIEDLTRTLPGRFTQAGQFIQPQGSSAFDRAAAVATGRSANALADIATKISYDTGEAQQGRRLDAAKALPGVTSTQVDSLIKTLQAQGLPRLIQQQGIDKGIELFNKRVDDLMRVLAVTAGVTQPALGTDSTSKSSQFSFGMGK